MRRLRCSAPRRWLERVTLSPVMRQRRRRLRERVELVWLPAFLVRFELRDRRASAERRGVSRPDRSTLLVLHDPVCGDSRVVDDPSSAFVRIEAGEILPPGPIPDVVDRAWGKLVAAAGPLRAGRMERREGAVDSIVHRPFWVEYTLCRGERLDVRLLDAQSGKPAGAKVKLAFLEALERQRSGAHVEARLLGGIPGGGVRRG